MITRKLYLLLYVAAALLLCSCHPNEENSSDIKSLEFGDYISISESFQEPSVPDISEYTFSNEVLNSDALANLFWENDIDQLQVSRMLDEGTSIYRGGDGYLQIAVRNFYYYVASHNIIKFEYYSSLLSENSQEGLRYGYFFNVDDTIEPRGVDAYKELDSICKKILNVVDTNSEVVLYHTEYLDYSGYSDDTVEIRPTKLRRFFWQFFVNNIPIYVPKTSYVKSGWHESGSLVFPYIEALEDEDGLQYIAGMYIPGALEKVAEPHKMVSVMEALCAFSQYYDDMILTDETAINITSVDVNYVMTMSGRYYNLIPAFVISFEQAGKQNVMLVNAFTGEIL